MKLLENLSAVASSSYESACVSLNSARESYAYQEAKRDGSLDATMQQAIAEYISKHGCTTGEAYLQVGTRAKYLEEMASGDLTFHAARVKMREQNKVNAVELANFVN